MNETKGIAIRVADHRDKTFEQYTGDGEIPEERQQIQEDLVQIRGELDRTLDQLGRRLEPDALKEQAAEKAAEVKEEAKDRLTEMRERVGDEPLVAGAVAAGGLLLTWLWIRREVIPFGLGAALGAGGAALYLRRKR